uniref:Uncharacterized protein n=1 Tax=Seriola dumerili TaxID=41447 RepID=A0A3B4TR93_SERDU
QTMPLAVIRSMVKPTSCTNGTTRKNGGCLAPGVYLSRDLSSIRVTGQRGRTWHDCKYGEVYDTSGLEENCVWDPKRIKINNTIKPSPVSSGMTLDVVHEATCELYELSPLFCLFKCIFL